MLTGLVSPGASAGTVRGERRVRPLTQVAPRATSSPTGLTPAKVKAAYDFPTSPGAGAGETVAVVVAFDHPRIENDLNEFSQKFGLPACTTANGCFKKVDYKGGKNYPARDKTWSMEVALDVQWVHAIAPGAKILLVEAKSDRLTDVLKAHDYATAHAKYVSNSWGLEEYDGQSPRNDHFDRPGVSIFVASGDDGAGPGYPATVPGVIAVGGTTLSGIGTSAFSETGWSGLRRRLLPLRTGRLGPGRPPRLRPDGLLRPAGDARRGSLVGDPRSGVSVYNSYKTTKPWMTLGGTSASTPMWAARAAAVRPGHRRRPASTDRRGIPFRDITVGATGSRPCPGSTW